MKKSKVILIVLLSCLFMLSNQVCAGESKFGIQISGQYVPFVSGDAGAGDDVPEYEDLFENGLSLMFEAVYRITPDFSLLGGIAYEHHSGQTFQGLSLEDLDIMPLSIGGKYYLKKEKSQWRPYFRGDIGVARFSSVDVSYLGTQSNYWDDSWEFMCDAGLGLEYKFDNFTFFTEIKVRYMGKPSEAPGLQEYAQSDSSISLPITLGVAFYF